MCPAAFATFWMLFAVLCEGIDRRGRQEGLLGVLSQWRQGLKGALLGGVFCCVITGCVSIARPPVRACVEGHLAQPKAEPMLSRHSIDMWP